MIKYDLKKNVKCKMINGKGKLGILGILGILRTIEICQIGEIWQISRADR